jgi:hypothetical protein
MITVTDQWLITGDPPPTDHVVRIVETWHWRGGNRYYARCECGVRSRIHPSRSRAENYAAGHATQTGGRVMGGVHRA